MSIREVERTLKATLQTIFENLLEPGESTVGAREIKTAAQILNLDLSQQLITSILSSYPQNKLNLTNFQKEMSVLFKARPQSDILLEEFNAVSKGKKYINIEDFRNLFKKLRPQVSTEECTQIFNAIQTKEEGKLQFDDYKTLVETEYLV